MSARPLLVVALLLGATTIATTTADAQARRVSVIPAETPPASFTGSQYVDSRGCVFVRTGSSGQVTWVPRFGADRQPVCGFQPSSAEAAQAQAEPVTPEATTPEARRVPMPELIVTAPQPDAPRILRPADTGVTIIAGAPVTQQILTPVAPATETARVTTPRRTQSARAATATTPATRSARPARVVAAAPHYRPAEGISPFAVPAADPWGWSAAPTPRPRSEPHAAATPAPQHPAAVRTETRRYVQVGASAVPTNA